MVIFILLFIASAVLFSPNATRLGIYKSSDSAPDSQNQRKKSTPEKHRNNLPLLLELYAAALESGLTLPRAMQVTMSMTSGKLRQEISIVSSALELGAPWKSALEAVGKLPSPEGIEFFGALDVSARSGAPARTLLLAQATRLRSSQHRAAEKRAAALGVKLVMPMGLCWLPAFICFGVFPMVVALIPAFH